jgi:hypothetical protein
MIRGMKMKQIEGERGGKCQLARRSVPERMVRRKENIKEVKVCNCYSRIEERVKTGSGQDRDERGRQVGQNGNI